MEGFGYSATFRLGSFDMLPVRLRCALVVYLTRALATINYLYLQEHPDTPSLYASDVVYRNQTWGADQWLDIPALLITGAGACEDFVAWRVAELHRRGIHAKVDVITQPTPDGKVVYHVVVRWPAAYGYAIEDPSALLGMSTGMIDPQIQQVRALARQYPQAA